MRSPYGSNIPSAWHLLYLLSDTDLLESVTFVCTDWEEAIVEACPPPDSGRGRGRSERSERSPPQLPPYSPRIKMGNRQVPIKKAGNCRLPVISVL